MMTLPVARVTVVDRIHGTPLGVFYERPPRIVELNSLKVFGELVSKTTPRMYCVIVEITIIRL